MSNKFYEATKTPDRQEASLWYCGLLVSGTFGHFSSFLNRCERYEYLPVEFSDKKPSLLHGLCELNSSQNLTTSLHSTAYKFRRNNLFKNSNSYIYVLTS